jgi:hypothetical protein
VEDPRGAGGGEAVRKTIEHIVRDFETEYRKVASDHFGSTSLEADERLARVKLMAVVADAISDIAESLRVK